MPLSCTLDGQTISAITFDESGWQALREQNAKNGRLALVCCGSRVTLKTSKLGTRFFAHLRRRPLDCAGSGSGESAEHLFAKACIAAAAVDAGWQVATEIRGTSPDGLVWIADVMATRGSAKVVFEVQLSPQSQEETERRQSLYHHSGVRALWFFGHASPIVPSRKVPAVFIEVDAQARTASVGVFGPRTDKAARDSTAAGVHQRVELGRFVRACLDRRFVWAPYLGEEFPVDVCAVDANCWACGLRTQIFTDFVHRIDHLMPGVQPIPVEIAEIQDPRLLSIYREALNKSGVYLAGIQGLDEAQEGSEMRTRCLNCHALQGRGFVRAMRRWASPVASISCTVPADLVGQTACWVLHDTEAP